MSAFKDAVQADIRATFLNLEEFGDIHAVNGVPLPCVLDTDVLTEGHPALEGVFLNVLTLYVKTSDLPRRPVEGELLYLDGKMHIVRRVAEEMGVLVITMEANEQ